MSEFRKCPKCGEYGFMASHTCKPVWHAVLLDTLDNADKDDLWQKVHAYGARDAAEVYAQNLDRADAIFSEVQFVVVRAKDDQLSYWEVRSELDPVYTAEEHKDRADAIRADASWGA